MQYNDDAMWWATAALYAHRAYGDTPDLLSLVSATWSHVNQFVITPADAKAKKMPGKDFALKDSCNGTSMVGGVFWRPVSGDKSVNSITTGLYLTASAYLASMTKNATYTNAAIQSAEWIRRQNLNADNLVLDTVNGNDCSRSPPSWVFTYNTGKYVEGLSVLADVTKNSTWTDLSTKIAAAGAKASHWEGRDGIITEGASKKNNDAAGFKAIFIRALDEVYTRTSNANLKTLLRSYIDVQYNALLNLASDGTAYSSDWHGPKEAYNPWGQLAALDVLVSAVNVNQS